MSTVPESDGQKFSHLYSYSGANKAGMNGIDKEKQAQIIYEMSKDSAYFKRAAKLDAETDAKVQAMKKTLINFKGSVEQGLREKVLNMSIEYEKKRSFERICCVLDMDMFFAAVEIRDQPHLKDLPVAVGGMSMISTANYIARKYGVRAAMPGFIAKKLCPQLIFVHSNFDKYQYISSQIIDIIKEYDPNYSSHSLDEVYFDLTNAAKIIWCSEQGFFPRKKVHEDNQYDQLNTDDTTIEITSSSKGSTDSSSTSKGNSAVSMDNSILDQLGHRSSIEASIQSSDHSLPTPTPITTAPPTASTTTSAVAQLFSKTKVMNEIFQSLHESDLPNVYTLRNIAVRLLQDIRQRITIVTKGLTCSAGIANNYYLAKICADVNKPNGQYELPPDREKVIDFVSVLPTRKVGGVGKVTERILERLLDIKTMGQVRTLLPQLLYTCTPILFQFLLRTSIGIGTEEGEYTTTTNSSSSSSEGSNKKTYQRKSLGCERTYSAKGIQDPIELYQKLHKICVSVGEDMVKDNLYAKTLTLKLKDTDFVLTTRSTTSLTYFQSVETMEALAKSLLSDALPMKVRLMGVSLSRFRHAEQQHHQDCIPTGQRSLLTFLQSTANSTSTTSNTASTTANTTSTTANTTSTTSNTTSTTSNTTSTTANTTSTTANTTSTTNTTADSSTATAAIISTMTTLSKEEDCCQGGADKVVLTEKHAEDVEAIVPTDFSCSNSCRAPPHVQQLSGHHHQQQQKFVFDLTSSPSRTERELSESSTTNISSSSCISNKTRDSSSSTMRIWLGNRADTDATAEAAETALPNVTSDSTKLCSSLPAVDGVCAADIQQRSDYVCPVCNNCISGTLGLFNAHLDRCLNQPPQQSQQHKEHFSVYKSKSNTINTNKLPKAQKKSISTHFSTRNNDNNSSFTTTATAHKRPRQEALILSIPDYFSAPTPK